jgi:hypothetical protein
MVPAPQPSPPEIVTDESGEFPYADGASFKKDGYRDPCVQYACYENYIEGDRFIVVYYLMPQVEVTGVLLNPGGSRAANRSIMALHVGAPRSDARYFSTDGEGRFHVTLDTVETDLFLEDEFCGAFRLQRIRPRPGQAISMQLSIPERRLGTLSGRVSNELLRIGFEEIVVRLLPAERFSTACARPMPDDLPRILPVGGGEFSIRGVPPGEYILGATLGARPTSDVGSPARSTTYAKMEVNGGDVRSANLTLHPNLELTGTLHFEGRTPGPYDVPEIRLTDQTGAWYHSRLKWVKEPESFAFADVQPGRYTLSTLTTGGAANFYLRELRVNGQPTAPDDLFFSFLEPKAHLDLYLSSNVAHLEIIGVDQERHPVSHYRAIVFSKPDGPYLLRGVWDSAIPPGDYRILLLPSQLPKFAIRADIISRYLDRAVQVSLSPGQTLKVEVPVLQVYPLAP